MRLKFAVIAVGLVVALIGVLGVPSQSVVLPCKCPFKSPTACAIYCGIY